MALIIAHRGASATYPENTVEAFRGAKEQAADWVELDVRRTVDDHLIIHHDPALRDGRTIVELSATELPSSVPSLREALGACDGMGVNVEIKNDETETDFDDQRSLAAPTLAVAVECLDPADLLVSSFDFAMVDAVRALDTPVPTALLFWKPVDVDELIATALAGEHAALNGMDELVNPLLVDAAHDAGLQVNVWTVDDPARMVELATMGVDGIVTNDPALARETLG